MKTRTTILSSLLAAILTFGLKPVIAQATQQVTLTHHSRDVVASGRAALVGRLPGAQRLEIAIMLPLRKHTELNSLLHQLYDPSNPMYRQFLTVDEFTEQFGPTEDDFQRVVDFAEANGFTVNDTPPNRMLVEVDASVAQIEKAFHVSMNVYEHPTENRKFFAPDREPSVDLDVPIWHIAGLDNYSIPKPMHHRSLTDFAVEPELGGSGPGGLFLPSDMRAAYYGAGALNGAGQSVGIFTFDGYLPADIADYFKFTGMKSAVPIKNVIVNGAGACAGPCDDGEDVLDVVNAIGMAPGLNQVLFYEGLGGTDAAILNRMATDNIAKQLSCSWGWRPADPVADDPIFIEFALQGQTFFAASDDSGAYSAGSPDWFPADDPWVTVVGGTDLTTVLPSGAWAAETAWVDSGGGISTSAIPIPPYQLLPGVINAANHGSHVLRNAPDVAAEADFDNITCSNGDCGGGWGGTSFATPRWAGYMALVNQQAALNGQRSVGFLNPTVYATGVGPSYHAAFHDIVAGNNFNPLSPHLYPAVPGYDLVTGWGSPNGPNLISALTRRPILAGEWDTADTKNSVYYLGFDSNLHQLAWNWGWTSGQDTGVGGRPAPSGSNGIAAYVNTIFNGNEVFYTTSVAGALHVEQLWAAGLAPGDLTIPGGGKPVAEDSNLVGYIDSVADSDNVFYLGGDQFVHVLTWTPAGGWKEDANLDATATPPAAASSPLAGHFTGASQEIFYIGANQHVYELWRWSKNFDGWHTTDVTEANGAKPVAALGSPLAGFYDAVTGNDSMFYIATVMVAGIPTQHVYELFFGNTAAWSAIDVTVLTGAPAAAIGSTLAAQVDPLSGNEGVYFFDALSNVQQLWAPSATPKIWHTLNLTALTGAALAFPGSPLTAFSSNLGSANHVFYIADDQNIHEFWWSNGAWNAGDDNTQAIPVAPNAVP